MRPPTASTKRGADAPNGKTNKAKTERTTRSAHDPQQGPATRHQNKETSPLAPWPTQQTFPRHQSTTTPKEVNGPLPRPKQRNRRGHTAHCVLMIGHRNPLTINQKGGRIPVAETNSQYNSIHEISPITKPSYDFFRLGCKLIQTAILIQIDTTPCVISTCCLGPNFHSLANHDSGSDSNHQCWSIHPMRLRSSALHNKLEWVLLVPEDQLSTELESGVREPNLR